MGQDSYNQTESEDETMSDDLDADSQYVWPDDDESDAAVGTDEEIKDVERDKLETNNVFMSLVQNIGKKRRNEPWVTVGTRILTEVVPNRRLRDLH